MASSNPVVNRNGDRNALLHVFGLASLIVAGIVVIGTVMITLAGDNFSSTAVVPPSMRPLARIEWANGSTSTPPLTLRGVQFDPNDAIEIFLQPSPNASFAQFAKLTDASADAGGNFVATLPTDKLSSGNYVVARGKSSGFTSPLGPISAPFPSSTPTGIVAPMIEVAPTSTPVPPPTPTPWPTPVPTPLPDMNPIGRWYSEYFANRDLIDSPVITRNEPVLNFNWGRGAPNAILPRDNFSARWVRREVFDQTENYQFTLNIDDGARLYFDDRLIINEWRIGPRRTVEASVSVIRGEHTLRVEYYSTSGSAFVSLGWRVNYDGWEGRYYNSTDFSGPVVFKRDDGAGDAEGFLLMDWGEGVPGQDLSNDNFSASWERSVLFPRTSEYRFNIEVDDGARIYIDGWLLYDNLNAVGAFEARHRLKRGRHFVQVQYIERSGSARIRVTWTPVEPEAAPAS